jgi:hypothetical protein
MLDTRAPKMVEYSPEGMGGLCAGCPPLAVVVQSPFFLISCS